MAVAPHALAAQSAAAILREGGNAVEAMVAAAATIAVVYPHMNSIGGDGFWLIARPGEAPRGLEACGAAAGAATIARYREAGLDRVPTRGGMAANTVAGTISGWHAALEWSREALGGRLPRTRLLADAIAYARDGVPVTQSQAACVALKADELHDIPGFAATFLSSGLPKTGQRFRQPRLASTLEQLARAGFDDFYRGDLANTLAGELAAAGSPLTLADLHAHRAVWKTPLELAHSRGTVYNMPPPTQGLVSLLILGQLDRLARENVLGTDPNGPAFVHACVEATKQAFRVRDRHITDPAYMEIDPRDLLAPPWLDAAAARIRPDAVLPWGEGMGPADTVWMGAIDRQGVAVSFIQSIYHEFGSGIVLPDSGVNWQNRGCSFSLDPDARNPLTPGRKPFHTLNPAMARLDDGRTLVYGNMGGDGQPQSQSAVFSRIVHYGMHPQAAIDAPRWLLGRTWGQTSDTLKLESRFPEATQHALRTLGHDVEMLLPYDETMGHAGAIVLGADGLYEGGSDPRSDGAAVGW
ncbi:gamma-glutamyltransferase family protein [Cupriavidus plantarum]|uniref:Gamma-glutamyltransferase 2 n=1 Tax=Cupriavidus plantarum TaxID=942865 RepID=A0A316F0E5_9BURK|nr:gamma-glutamyltransferase [Cupriavidus plantarum]PWK37585.1 gamma-glutamyltransferase 2 [Cupriavidus plantarum]CAG2128175.1 Oxamate amidohydrolase proenzyme [Cupriavidus plantarum]SMR66643.1 gamma-glutamyltransferase 2. Threonine peptidase. MEROPS family T03 [Cupriavidus plantarum]